LDNADKALKQASDLLESLDEDKRKPFLVIQATVTIEIMEARCEYFYPNLGWIVI